MTDDRARALRAEITPAAADGELPTRLRTRALELGLLGWVRGDAAPGEPVAVHVEGRADAMEALLRWLAEAGTPGEPRTVKVEGHEQFAVRGVSAGVFVVQEHQASTHHYDLRLQVGDVMRSWAVPKGPSLDPAVKRLAVQVDDHSLSHNAFEGVTGSGGVIVWDHGGYEQGGRVPWPEALRRGHAVFVLHGEKLRGGFALQRTGGGQAAQWLLVKRRDDAARPGSDITAEQPESVAGGGTLAQLLETG